MIQTVPKELTLRFYSRLRKNQKTYSLRELLNEFAKSFGIYRDIVSTKGNWKKRLDSFYTDSSSLLVRDVLIAYWQRTPAGAQEFSINLTQKEAYDEGIYISPDFQKRKIGTILRDTLLNHLKQNNVKAFYIGKKGFDFSDKVRKSRCAQALAEKDIRELSDNVIELERTPKRGFVSSYGIGLRKYSPRFQSLAHVLEKV